MLTRVSCSNFTLSKSSTVDAHNPAFYKCASGFYIDLLLVLKERLAFTFEIYEVEDKKWGSKVNNTWNGLMREILTGDADMAMTSLKITKERSEAIDFSIPFMDTGIAIMVSLRPGKYQNVVLKRS